MDIVTRETEAGDEARASDTEQLTRGVPRTPSDLITRPRLIRRLGELAGVALVVVRGPRGSGKTALLANWARSSSRPVIWVGRSQLTRGSAVLLHHIVRDLARIGLLSDGEVRDASNGIARDPDPWLRFADCLHDVRDPFTLVLDGADEADDETLRGLLDAVRHSATLHLVATEHRSTLLDHDGLGLVLDRETISGAELRFDATEIGAAFGIGPVEASELEELTGGLAVVIHALARAGRHLDTPARLVHAATTAIESYFAIHRSTVARADEAPAIVRAAAADELSVGLAAQLLEIDDATAALEDFERDGYGRWVERGDDRAFVFIPPVLRMLRRELERWPDVSRRAATIVIRWNARHGRAEQALELALRTDDLALASEVVKTTWFTLLRDHGPRVRVLLSAVPMPQLRHHPLLAMLLALCYNATGFRRAKSVQLFAIAASAGRSKDDRLTPSDRILLRASESAALRVLGQTARAVPPAVDAVESISRLNPDEREVLVPQLPILYAHLGISLHYGGREEDALEALEQGLAEAVSGDFSAGLTDLAMLAGLRAFRGDLPEASRYIGMVRAHGWSDDELNGYRGTFFRLAEAIVALEEFDVDAADGALHRMVHDRETIEHWRAIAQLEGMVGLLAGQPAAALARLDTFAGSRGRAGSSADARADLASVRTFLHLATGDLGGAHRVQRRDAGTGARTEIDRARIALVENRVADTLLGLRKIAGTEMSSRLRAEAAVLEVAALLRTGEQGRRSRSAFEFMCGLLRDRELRMPLALVPRVDLERIAAHAAEASEHDLLHPGLRSVFELPDATPQLSQRELVVLQALVRTASAAEIAAELYVSVNTVKSQLKSIYRKLGAANRDEAVRSALGLHLVSRDSED